jgi:hypothetical protein
MDGGDAGPTTPPRSGAKRPLTPLSATRSVSQRWRPVVVLESLVNVQGGYSTRDEAANSIQYQSGGTIHTYLELDKNAGWFLRGVGGETVRKGDLKTVAVMSFLRAEFGHKLNENLDEDTAVAEETDTAVAEDVDPMDAMDDLPDVPVATKKQAKKKRIARETCRSLVLDLVVPARPPCAGCTEGETTVVYLYRKPRADRRTNGKLYLRSSCIEWLLSYAADELAFQGVTATPSTPSPARAGNCTAVADFHLKWDLKAKEWEGTFVAGALEGTTKRMSVNDIIKETWNKLLEEELVHGYFGQATLIQRKNAVKQLLTMWAAAEAHNDATGGDPEDKLRRTQLVANGAADDARTSLAPSTPARGAKRSLEETAVAAE